MSETHTVTPRASEEAAASEQNPDYWHSLINEDEGADFLGLTNRTMQAMRQRGDGPRFIRISSRCIRYTRALLKSYADTLCHGWAPLQERPEVLAERRRRPRPALGHGLASGDVHFSPSTGPTVYRSSMSAPGPLQKFDIERNLSISP